MHPATTLNRWLSILLPGMNRMRFFYNFLNSTTISLFQQTVSGIKPDLIWSEHLIENFLALQAGVDAPVVYSHHDFLWKIRAIRQGPTWRNQLFRQAEINLIKKNKHIVSGSVSELEEIKQVNPMVYTAYLPPHYPSVSVNYSIANEKPGIVHLGGLSITANRMGLKRFMEAAWPTITQKHAPELCIIGRADNVPEEVKALLDKYGIKPIGFVDDLSSVLKPYDIHVIPYEGDTGVRTRLPQVLNYNQVLVSTKNACKGIIGLVHLENCVLADNVEEMSPYIIRILDGQLDYHSIADNGKVFFEEAFTLSGQQEKMKNLLQIAANL